MDQQILLKEASNGSAAAQKCLFDLYAEKMMMVCRRYLRNREDAEEIMLDGFCKFFKNLSSFNYNGDAAMQSWIKKIMINECLMFLRKKNVFNLVAETAADEIPFADDTLNNLSAAEIFNLIVELPTGYCTVFNLFVIEGFEHKEIAAMLNITEGTSKSQLSKARTLLQKLLIKNSPDYAIRKAK
jgi:RNA polymerase sigma-70 factor (ECF subfamily)